MLRTLWIPLALIAIVAAMSVHPVEAALSERRLALVIGNASYQAKTLSMPVNDAALVAQTLEAARFEVMGARDLDEDSLREAFRDFIATLTKSGPDTVAAIYFAGYVLQLDGENYLVPIGANITRDSDIPTHALQLTEPMHELAGLHLKATFVILDAARANPFALSGQPLADGFAWSEAEPNMLIAFNATPGTIAPDFSDAYGPYAKALTEMIREGGLAPVDLFNRVRLRVNDLTNGAQVPWDASRIDAPFAFFERGLGAPTRTDSPAQTAWMRSQPMGHLGAQNAYAVALLRDTFDGYGDFLADFGQAPIGKRILALLAVRREAISWRRSYQANTPAAYWTYLKRYPRGPHAADARRLLVRLTAATEPPPTFRTMDYDVSAPPLAELKYLENPALDFNDPQFAFAPPPPTPAQFLETPPAELVALKEPPAPHEAHSLPILESIRLPDFINPPENVLLPANKFIFSDIHNPVEIVNASNDATISDKAGGASSLAGAAPISPSVPPRVAPNATQTPLPPAANPAQRAIELSPNQILPTAKLTVPLENGVPATPRVATLAGSDDHPPAIDNRSPPHPDQSLTTAAPPAEVPPTASSIPLPNSAERKAFAETLWKSAAADSPAGHFNIARKRWCSSADVTRRNALAAKIQRHATAEIGRAAGNGQHTAANSPPQNPLGNRRPVSVKNNGDLKVAGITGSAIGTIERAGNRSSLITAAAFSPRGYSGSYPPPFAIELTMSNVEWKAQAGLCGEHGTDTLLTQAKWSYWGQLLVRNIQQMQITDSSLLIAFMGLGVIIGVSPEQLTATFGALPKSLKFLLPPRHRRSTI